eukprot:UN33524
MSLCHFFYCADCFIKRKRCLDFFSIGPNFCLYCFFNLVILSPNPYSKTNLYSVNLSCNKKFKIK